MRSIFYIKYQNKLKQVYEYDVPDDAKTYKLIGVACVDIETSTISKYENTLMQEIVFQKVSDGKLTGEAMFVFDADRFVK